MRRLFKPCKIFLSHKNIDGKAAYSTVLLKDKLDKKLFFHVIFDKHEKEMEEFPSYIKEAIFNSDVYILKIPDNGNVDFLLDESNWVHKEIKYALVQKVINPKYKIIPVSFNSKFLWDSSGVKLDKDIEKIKDYNICYVDSDERNFESKIYDRIGYPLKNVVNTKLLLTIVAILLMISAWIGYSCYDSYLTKKNVETVEVIHDVLDEEFSNFKSYDIKIIESDSSLKSLYISIDKMFVLTKALKAPKREITGDYLSKRAVIEFLENCLSFYEHADHVNKSLNSFKLSTGINFMLLNLRDKSHINDSTVWAQLLSDINDLELAEEEVKMSRDDFQLQLDIIVDKVKKYRNRNDKANQYKVSYFYYNVKLWNNIERLIVRSVDCFKYCYKYSSQINQPHHEENKNNDNSEVNS